MQIYSNSRRNFLTSIAILSAGTAFKPAVKHLPAINEKEDLQKNWESFWKKYGGQKFYILSDPQKHNTLLNTKGHLYRNGEVIYFSRERIIAEPTWIFWGNNISKPSDVIVTLFENNSSLKKIARLNRFEINALYNLSKDYCADNLLVAHCNNLNPVSFNITSVVKNKIKITKNSQIQQVSYYKEQALVSQKKFIYHT